jgi:hypothetical protein
MNATLLHQIRRDADHGQYFLGQRWNKLLGSMRWPYRFEFQMMVLKLHWTKLCCGRADPREAFGRGSTWPCRTIY